MVALHRTHLWKSSGKGRPPKTPSMYISEEPALLSSGRARTFIHRGQHASSMFFIIWCIRKLFWSVKSTSIFQKVFSNSESNCVCDRSPCLGRHITHGKTIGTSIKNLKMLKALLLGTLAINGSFTRNFKYTSHNHS